MNDMEPAETSEANDAMGVSLSHGMCRAFTQQCRRSVDDDVRVTRVNLTVR